jgi:hypothetical protein
LLDGGFVSLPEKIEGMPGLNERRRKFQTIDGENLQNLLIYYGL